MAGSIVGTIKVPVGADIAQAQQSLQSLRKFAENLDLGSSLGRSIDKALSGVERSLSKFEGKDFLRISSESQLTKYQTDLQDIYNQLNNIAGMAQTITVGDLNTSKFTGELQNLQTQLQNLIQQATAAAGIDFSKAIKSSSEMQAAFSAIGQDLNKLDISKVSKTLETGISGLNKELETARKNLEQVTAEQKKLESVTVASGTVNQKNRMSQIKQATEGYLNDIKINPSSFKQLQNSFQTLLNSDLFKGIDTNIQEKLRTVLENGLNGVDGSSLSAEKLRSVFQTIKADMQTIFTENSGSAPTGFFKTLQANFEADAGNLRQSVSAKTSELKSYLSDQLAHIMPNESETNIKSLVNNFIQILETGDWDKAKTVLLSKFKEINDAALKAGGEHEKAIKEIAARVAQAQKDFTTAETKLNNAKGGKEAYSQIEAVFAQRLTNLESQIQSLKEQIDQKGSEKLNNLKGELGGQVRVNQEAVNQLTSQVQKYGVELDHAKAKEKLLGQVSGIIQRWVGVYAAVRYVTKAFQDMKKAVAEVDRTITNISIVTGMSQDKLWGQMDSYIAKAQKFAASISGVYEVSQLYYQQGLETADVSALTDETLKLATVSGLGYTEATNYMTNAVRSFKMEMADAATVTDTYAALAASAATSVSEIAVAMSKTASSAQAVGMTLQDTATMITVMTEATREAPENIGSALKSIISRYGELKENPTALTDSEGQEMSFNKVDKALSSVGISMKDTNGQFRSFTDVIVELSEKWNTLDTNTQRYIATVMAGNRQQSRFLALVSSGERLSELMVTANDAEGAGTEQYMAYLDSIEAKQTKLANSWKALYMTEGIQNGYKTVLDILTSVSDSLNSAEKYGLGLWSVIQRVGTTFYAISHLVTSGFTNMMARINAQANVLAQKKLDTENKLKEEEKGTNTLTPSNVPAAPSSTPSSSPISPPGSTTTTEVVEKKETLDTSAAEAADKAAEAAMESSKIEKTETNNTENAKAIDASAEAAMEASTIDKKETLDTSASTTSDAAAESNMEASIVDKKEQLDTTAAEATAVAADGRMNGKIINREMTINTTSAETQANVLDARMKEPIVKSVQANTQEAQAAIDQEEARQSDPIIKPVEADLTAVTSALQDAQTGAQLLGEALAQAGVTGGTEIATAVSNALTQATTQLEQFKQSLSNLSMNATVNTTGSAVITPTTAASVTAIPTQPAIAATAMPVETPQIDTTSLQQAQTILQEISTILQQITSELTNFSGSIQSLPTTLETLKTSFQELSQYLQEMPELNVKFDNIEDISAKFDAIAKSANDMVQAIQNAQTALNTINGAATKAGNGLKQLKTKNKELQQEIQRLKQEINDLKGKLQTTDTAGKAAGAGLTATGAGAEIANVGIKKLGQSFKQFLAKNGTGVLSVVMMLANALSTLGPIAKFIAAGILLATAAMVAFNTACMSNPFVAIAMAIISAIMLIVEAFKELDPAAQAQKRLEELQKAADEAKDKMTEKRSESKKNSKEAKNLQKLADAQYDSEEALKAYHEEQNKIFEELGDQIPGLLAGYDEWGNALINVGKYYEYVNQLAQESAEATAKSVDAEIALNKERVRQGKMSSQEANKQKKMLVNQAMSEGVNARISAYNTVGSRYYNPANADLFTQHAEAQNIMSSLMTVAFTKSGAASVESWMNSSSYQSTLTSVQQKITEFYSELGSNVDKLTELQNNKGRYTRVQYEQQLRNLGIDDAEILNYFMEQYGEWEINFEQALLSSSRLNRNTSSAVRSLNSFVRTQSQDFIGLISTQEKQSILSYYDSLAGLLQDGIITSDTAEQLADAYLNLWNIAVENNDEELQTILEDYGAGRISYTEMITRTRNLNRDWGEQQNEIDSSLNTIQELSPNNIISSINTFINGIANVFTDLEKSINNLTKGLSFSEMETLASQNNLHISDFSFKNGKFYLNDIEEGTASLLLQARTKIDEINSRMAELIPLSQIMVDFDRASKTYTQTRGRERSNAYEQSWAEGAQLLLSEDENEYLNDEAYIWNKWNEASNENKIDSLQKFLKLETRQEAEILLEEVNSLYTQWTGLTNERRAEYGNSFLNYIQQEASALIEDYNLSLEYLDYIYSSAYIGIGNIQQWLTQSQNTDIAEAFSNMQHNNIDKFNSILSHIETLDWDWLINSGNLTSEQLEYILQYADELYNAYHDVHKDMFSSVISSIQSGQTSISVTNYNRELLRSIGAVDAAGQALSDSTTTAFIDFSHATDQQLNELEQMIIQDATLTENTKRTLLSQLHTTRYENTFYNRITKALASFDNVTYNVLDGIALSLGKTVEELISEAGEAMIQIDPLTGNYKIDPGYLRQLIFNNLDDQTNKVYNSLIGKIDDAEYKTSNDKQWMDIINNYTKLSGEMVGNLATLLDTSIDEFKELGLLTDNGNGTWSIQLAQLQAWVNEKYTNGIPAAIQQQLNSAYDTVLKGISSATQLQTKGTTSWSDMWNTYNQIRQVFGDYSDIHISSLYNWDEEIGSYTITSEGLRDQILLYQQQIIQSGKDINDAARHMFENNAVQLAKAIDVKSYLSNRNDDTWKKIEKAIDNYNQYVEAYNSTLTVPYWSTGADGKLSLPSRMVEEQNLPILKSINAEVLRGMLDVGGFAAIEALKQISDISKTDYSTSDYKSAYLSGITNLTKTVGDQVNVSVGGVVDKATYDILNINNAISFDTTYAEQGIYVVTAINNLSEAYKNYMNEIINTAGRTAADINAAAAQYLTYAEDWGGGEQSVIEAASSATSMTYEAFGTLLAEYGIQMTDATMEILREAGYVQALGGNKMAIIDFASFAQNILNISPDSPEYVSALKTYNDSLIAFNKKVSTNILSEFKNLENANIWDQLNFTEFFSALSQISSSMTHTIVNETDTGHFNVEEVEFDNVAEELNTQLHDFGAYIKDGILQITEGADILSITKTIAEYMQEYGNLTSAELAELADSIHTIVQNYVDMIKNGIAGSLTNANAQKLSAWAESRGLGQLDFTHTAEGLQLSVESAKRLYFEMKKIDQFAAANLFEDLSERILSREGTNRYDVLNRKVDELIAKRNQLQAQPERSANNDRAIQELNEEIQLYQQLALAQMNVASNYSWMDNQLPEGLQGPVNYFNAAGTAFAAMKKGYEDGYLAPQDFFNMVTEFGNMAQTAGTDLTIAGYNFAADGSTTASLIEQGFSAIKYVEGQGMVIDLSGVGMSLEASAEGLDQGMNKGIKAVAEAQVSVWEGIVSMLEVVAQIEALGDIDTDNDMHITLPEIVVTGANGENTGVYQQRIQEWRNQMLAILDSNDEATQATRDFLNNTKINGQALSNIIRKDASELTEQDAIAYDFIYQMAQHDWDINALPTEQLAAFQEAAERSGGAIEVDIGDVHYVITGTQVYSIDWGDDSDARRDVLEALNLSNEEATSLVAGYLSDPDNASTQQIEAYYSYRGIITLGSNDAPEIRFSDGNGHIVPINKLNKDGSENPLWANALEALKLTNLGYDRDQIVFDQQTRTASVDVVIGSGTNGFHYNLVYDTTNSTYSTINSHGQTFSGTPSQISDWQTQQLFLDWKDWQARLGNEIEGSSSDWRYNKDFLLHYGIDFTPTLNATSARSALGADMWDQVRELVQVYLAGGNEEMSAEQAEIELKDILVKFGFDINEDADMHELLTSLGFESVTQTVHIEADGDTWVQSLVDDKGTTHRVVFSSSGDSFDVTDLKGEQYNADVIRGLWHVTKENEYWNHFGSYINGVWTWNEDVRDHNANGANVPNWTKIFNDIQTHDYGEGVFPYYEIVTNEDGSFSLRSGSASEQIDAAAGTLNTAAGNIETAAGKMDTAAGNLAASVDDLTGALTREENMHGIAAVMAMDENAALNFVRERVGVATTAGVTNADVRTVHGEILKAKGYLGEDLFYTPEDENDTNGQAIITADLDAIAALEQIPEFVDQEGHVKEVELSEYVQFLAEQTKENGIRTTGISASSYDEDQALIAEWLNGVESWTDDENHTINAREASLVQKATEARRRQQFADTHEITEDITEENTGRTITKAEQASHIQTFLTTDETGMYTNAYARKLQAAGIDLQTISYQDLMAAQDQLDAEAAFYSTTVDRLTMDQRNTYQRDKAMYDLLNPEGTPEDQITAYDAELYNALATTREIITNTTGAQKAKRLYNLGYDITDLYFNESSSSGQILADNIEELILAYGEDWVKRNITATNAASSVNELHRLQDLYFPDDENRRTKTWSDITAEQGTIASYYGRDISDISDDEIRDYYGAIVPFDELQIQDPRTGEILSYKNLTAAEQKYIRENQGLLASNPDSFTAAFLNNDVRVAEAYRKILQDSGDTGALEIFDSLTMAAAIQWFKDNYDFETNAVRMQDEDIALRQPQAYAAWQNLDYDPNGVKGDYLISLAEYIATYGDAARDVLRNVDNPEGKVNEDGRVLSAWDWVLSQGNYAYFTSSGGAVIPFPLNAAGNDVNQGQYLTAQQRTLKIGNSTVGYTTNRYGIAPGFNTDHPELTWMYTGHPQYMPTNGKPATINIYVDGNNKTYNPFLSYLPVGGYQTVSGYDPASEQFYLDYFEGRAFVYKDTNQNQHYERVTTNEEGQVVIEKGTIAVDGDRLILTPESTTINTNNGDFTVDGKALNDIAGNTNTYHQWATQWQDGLSDTTQSTQKDLTQLTQILSDFSYGNASITDVMAALNELNPENEQEAITLLNLALQNLGSAGQSTAELLNNAINALPDNATINLTYNVTLEVSTTGDAQVHGNSTFTYTGNISGAGNPASAKGTSTLMGELGPELVVSGGKYFVVGQNGAEFVNLDKDAIVFNHLQTKRLLNTGRGGHGKPITNEREATSFAKGNASGPAMASASAALNSARQILAAWQSLAKLGLSDFAQKAGGGGGGGGKEAEAYIADLDLWYNLLREIDRLEASITYQETLRSKIEKDRIIDGKAYYNSQKESIKLLEDEISKKHQLVNLQKSYYDARVEDLKESPYGQFITYDDHGHLQHTDDYYTKLGDLMATNNDDSPKHTAKEQYDMLVSWGFKDLMAYDNSGKKIDMSKDEGYTSAVQAFWDKMESRQEEIDDLYDGYMQYQEDILKEETKYNELLQQIIDNQVSVENRINKAIEDMKQREIDEAKSQKDAIQQSSEKFIKGLTDSLEKERSMYETNESDNELNRLRRQLSILQRSGGSASQIRSLQQDIAAREQDSYFEAQQNQIDAIQAASDAEMERLDHQIKIMEEQLAYEKEHGLLWNQVYEVMAMTPEEIENFILVNSKDFEGKSTLQIAEDLRVVKSEIEQWVSRRDDSEDVVGNEPQHNWSTYYEAASNLYHLDEEKDAGIISEAKQAYEAKYAETGDENYAARAADEVFDKYRGPRPGTQAIGNDDGSISDNTSSTSTTTKVKVQFIHLDAATGDIITNPTSAILDSGKQYNKYSYKASVSNYSYANQPGGNGFIATYKGQVQIYYNKKATFSPETTKTTIQGYKVTGLINNTPVTKQFPIAAAPNANIAQELFKKIPGYSGQIMDVSAYSKGGLANYTGLAIVHGSKQDPEAFLNAEETHMWRDKILSGNNGSLTSMLLDFQNMVSGMVNSENYSSIGASEGINIENAVVNMNATISNDYDARRAADTVMEEMVRIARKTTAQQARR